MEMPPNLLTPAYKVTTGLGTSSPTKKRWGNPFMGIGSIGRQESQGQSSAPIAGGPTWKPSSNLLHMCVGMVVAIGPAHVFSLVGVSVSGRPQGFKLVDWVFFLWNPYLLWSFSPSSKSSKTLGASSNVWLLVSANVSVNCWLEPLRGHLC